MNILTHKYQIIKQNLNFIKIIIERKKNLNEIILSYYSFILYYMVLRCF
jgi:hypothetical protein